MIIKIAVERTVDPMPEVMNSLFGQREILISDKVLEMLKQMHSYSKITKGNYDEYTFHRRTRGTDALFSFIVTTGADGNKASNLECIVAELGIMGKDDDVYKQKNDRKIYFVLQDEI